jgi:ABC-2 type transport system ATP-binding protein
MHPSRAVLSSASLDSPITDRAYYGCLIYSILAEVYVNCLEVEGISKQYDRFHLRDVSFSLEQGNIMGFIGVNGAGKTTTLKSILKMVHPDSGVVRILGKDFRKHELELKQEIGVVLGDKDVYKQYRIGRISGVISRFYRNWDPEAYEHYCRQFNLDQNKKLAELSAGMQTKFFLTLALSHNAKLFILDEPTSGLDPAARDELLEIFQELVEDGSRSILYSTHITSDLEKCADFVTYIDNGTLLNVAAKDDFIESYRIVRGPWELLTDDLKQRTISHRKREDGVAALIRSADSDNFHGFTLVAPSIEEIMIFHARRNS